MRENSSAAKVLEAIKSVSKLINLHGVPLRALSDREESKVRQMPINVLAPVLKAMTHYREVIADIEKDKERSPIERDKHHLQAFLKKHRLKFADSQFTNLLEEGLLVELYSLGHQQIFRSVEFFNISNYDLETLVFVPWNELFYRDEKIFENILRVIGKVIAEQIPHWENPPIKEHILKEVYDGKDGSFLYKMKHIGAVLDEETGGTMGYATIIKVQEVDDKKIKLL